MCACAAASISSAAWCRPLICPDTADGIAQHSAYVYECSISRHSAYVYECSISRLGNTACSNWTPSSQLHRDSTKPGPELHGFHECSGSALNCITQLQPNIRTCNNCMRHFFLKSHSNVTELCTVVNTDPSSFFCLCI